MEKMKKDFEKSEEEIKEMLTEMRNNKNIRYDERLRVLVECGLWCGELKENEAFALYAYYAGRRDACHALSDSFSALMRKQRTRARNCRYHRMAMDVVGSQKYIYSPDYRAEDAEFFGEDIYEDDD